MTRPANANVTPPVDGGRTLHRIYMDRITPGTLVELKTENSTYWIVPTVPRQIGTIGGTRMVAGMSITTDSETFGQTKRPPTKYAVQALIELNHSLQINGEPNSTTPIKMIRIIDAVE